MQVNHETQDVKSSTLPPAGMDLISTITSCLDNNKAEEINTIDLNGKSGIADYLVIANGRSARQVGALADYVLKALKEVGVREITVEGLSAKIAKNKKMIARFIKPF